MIPHPTPFPDTLLGATIAAVVPRDAAAERAARERLDQRTKPRGSLGVLEDVATFDSAGVTEKSG